MACASYNLGGLLQDDKPSEVETACNFDTLVLVRRLLHTIIVWRGALLTISILDLSVKV